MKLTKIFSQWTQGVPQITDATQIWVSKSGSDATGDGTVVLPVASITKAFTLVSATRKTILVLPGVYAEAAALVWPLFDNVQLVGLGSVIISAAGTTQVIGIAPGAVADTFDAWMFNIYIDHTNSGQDGILLDNTSMTKKLMLYLKNVGGDADDGNMIATVHGDTSNAIRIYWNGDGGEGVEGAVNFTGGDGGDRLHIRRCDLNGGLATSVTDCALDVRLVKCIIKHEGITGGHATQTIDIVNCYSETSGTFAKADASDVAGNQTETIVD